MSQQPKTFLKAAARVTLALFLALGGLIGAIFLVVWIREKVQAKADAPLATPLIWPSTGLASDDTLQLTTIWRDGRTYFKVLLHWKSSPRGPTHMDANFTMFFEDKNGFKVAEQKVYLKDMLFLVDKNGEVTDMEWQGSQLMPSDTYRSLATLRGFSIHWPVTGPTPATTPGL